MKVTLLPAVERPRKAAKRPRRSPVEAPLLFSEGSGEGAYTDAPGLEAEFALQPGPAPPDPGCPYRRAWLALTEEQQAEVEPAQPDEPRVHLLSGRAARERHEPAADRQARGRQQEHSPEEGLGCSGASK